MRKLWAVCSHDVDLCIFAGFRVNRVRHSRSAKLKHDRAACDSLPPCGGGSGWGVEPRGTEVPHLATPTPNPAPQGGGEESAARPCLRRPTLISLKKTEFVLA